MKHIKNISSFKEGLFSSSRMNSKEFLDYTMINYKSMANDSLFDVSTQKSDSYDYTSISWNKTFGREKGYHISLDSKDGKYIIKDFKNDKGESEYEGNGSNPIVKMLEITKSEFDKYRSTIEVIEEFLDNKEEEVEDSKKSSIDKDGNLNIKSDKLDEVNYHVSNELKKHLNKSFTFDTKYVKWTASDKNIREIEELSFKVTDFNVDTKYSLEDSSYIEFYGKIIVTCPIDNKSYYIWIDQDFKNEWVDLSKQPKYSSILRLVSEEPLPRRKIMKFFNKKENYPNYMFTALTPSKYNSIEMINDLKDILQVINDQIKKK